MPFLKFGKKKDSEDDDLEAPEDSGLLMSTKGEQPASAGESAPDPASPEPLDPAATEGETIDAERPGGEGAEEGDPLLEATLADPAAVVESATEAAADTGGSNESDAVDSLAAFRDDESHIDVSDLVQDIEDVAASSLLEELREIRLKLPPEALDQGEDAA